MSEENNSTEQESICLLSGFIAEIVPSQESDTQLNALSKLFYDHMLKLVYSNEMKAFPNISFLGESQFGLDPETMNCRRCSECQTWATNIGIDNTLDYLTCGREIEGLFRCIQCEDAPNM